MDCFTGTVMFPVWACKYLKKPIKTYEKEDQRVNISLPANLSGNDLVDWEQEEAPNGEPGICDELHSLYIPYDIHHNGYEEIKAMTESVRFLEDGRFFAQVRLDEGLSIYIKTVLDQMAQPGTTLESLQAWLQEKYQEYAPVQPSLTSITEADYLEHLRIIGRTPVIHQHDQ